MAHIGLEKDNGHHQWGAQNSLVRMISLPKGAVGGIHAGRIQDSYTAPWMA